MTVPYNDFTHCPANRDHDQGQTLPIQSQQWQQSTVLLQTLPGLTKVLEGIPQMFLTVFAFSIGYGWGGNWAICPAVQISTAHRLHWCDPGLMKGSVWAGWCCWMEESHISSIFICEDSSWPESPWQYWHAEGNTRQQMGSCAESRGFRPLACWWSAMGF